MGPIILRKYTTARKFYSPLPPTASKNPKKTIEHIDKSICSTDAGNKKNRANPALLAIIKLSD